jgi:outer membrane protein assembly factor BamB
MKSIVISLLAFLAYSECFSQNEFAQWRGPERNGIYPDTNLMTQWPEGGPRLLWKYDSLGIGYSSAAVTSDRIYTIGVIDSTGYVFSFDPQGNLAWKKPLGRDFMGEWPGTYSTPVINGRLGYVVNGLGVLYCFDAGNGEVYWSKDLLKEFKGQPGLSGFLDNLIVDNEKLYCTPGGIGKNVVALNSKTGEFLWASAGDTAVNAYCTPILIEKNDRKYFIYQTNRSIISLDSDNGKLVWKFDRKGHAMPNTPLYQDGCLLIPDFNNGSIKLKISEDGLRIDEVWRTPNMQMQMGDAMLLGDRVFARGKRNKFYCIDWNTGQELYSESAKGMVTSLISAENLLYCYDMAGNFSLEKPLDNRFEKVGSFKVMGGTENHCSHPVINDGKLYIRHDNSLFVYNISKKVN